MTPTPPDITDAISVADAATQLRTTPQTLYRWITTGTRIPGVGMVRLGAVRVGGHYVVQPAAIDQFLIACNPAASAATPTPAAIKRRGEEAKRRLAERLKRGV